MHPSCAEPCAPDLVPPLEGDTPGRGAPLHEFADLSDARPGTTARPQDQPGLDLDQPSHYVPQASVCGGLGG